MNIKSWKKFNELYQDTYWRAARKVGYGTKRSDKLTRHAEKKGIYKNYPFLDKLIFNIFVHSWINQEEGNEEYPDKIVKMRMSDSFSQSDIRCGNLNFYSVDDDSGEVIVSITFDDNKLEMDLGYTQEGDKKYTRKYNKFADRQSMKRFMKVLEKMYFTDNPNISANAIAKINKAKVTEMTYKDMEGEWDNFWKFLDQNGYDWERFESEINTNKLWDDLMPNKINPQWTTDHT